MVKKWIKENKAFLALSVCIFVLFFALAMFFPYTGDDWAWGSHLGITRLKSGFSDYNGRYLGNILVIFLTRSKVLDALVMAVCFYAMSLSPYLLTKKKNPVFLLLPALILLVLPKAVLVQAYVWTAGFTNYVPPILLAVYYIIFVKNIFEDKVPEYSRFMPVLVFFMGACACLFMENITLYCLALGGLVILYSFIKFRKFFLTHCAFFAGSVVGSAIMFSNSSYRNILNNTDPYRSTADAAEDMTLKETIIEHLDVISTHFFTNSIYLCIAVTVVTVLLSVYFLKKSDKRKALVIGNTALHTLCFGLILYFYNFPYWRFSLTNDEKLETTHIFIAAVCFVYLTTVLIQVLLCIDEKRERGLFALLILSIYIIIVPLLVVNPIGPRCFFPPYYVLAVFLTLAVSYLTENISLTKSAWTSLGAALSAGVLGVFIFLFTIYVPIHHYDALRLEYLKKQAANGQTTVTMCELPYNSYVWMPNAKSELWTERYKNFYHLDEELEFEYLSYSEYEEWLADYNAE